MISPYHRCRDCRFWVSSQDANCPNCGIVRPYEQLAKDEYLTKVALDPTQHGCFFGLVYLVLWVMTILIVVNQQLGSGLDLASYWLLMVGTFVIPLVLMIVGFKLLKRAVGIRPDRKTRADRSLRQSEQTIHQRLNEIEARQAQIRSVQARANENGGAEWQEVRRTLREAARMLLLHHARYNAKAIEVEAVRWQNTLNPLFYGWESLTYERTERRLKALDKARARGVDLQGRLVKESDTIGDTSDFKELSTRLSETLVSCKRVHDGLVGRQAVLALKGLSPLQDAPAPVPGPTAERRAIEVFNTEVALTDFSTSFAELESEYTRLQSEDNVAQEIRSLLERADY